MTASVLNLLAETRSPNRIASRRSCVQIARRSPIGSMPAKYSLRLVYGSFASMTYMGISLVGRRPSPAPPRSEPAALCEGRDRHADDEVIEHPNIDLSQRAFQALGQRAVGGARLRHARRMVVREDHRSGVGLQRRPDDLARIHRRAVDGADTQRFHFDDAVLVVEPQREERFARLVGQLRQQKPANSGRVLEGVAPTLDGQTTLQNLRRLLE